MRLCYKSHRNGLTGLYSVHEIMRKGYYNICKTKIQSRAPHNDGLAKSFLTFQSTFFRKLNVKLDHKEELNDRDKMNEIINIKMKYLVLKLDLIVVFVVLHRQ